MPYPLPQQPSTVGGQRVRLLPPVGCPGVEQWVLPMEFSRWAELGYRKGPIPAADLELFWLPADARWNEPIGSAAIELLINPRQSFLSPISVTWGDGGSNVVPWSAVSRQAPRLRHVYAQRADVTVQVQLGLLVATLRVALVGCPVPPQQLLNNRDGGGGSTAAGTGGVIQPLIPSGGISGEPYDGRHAVVWRLRLHPNGGLGFLPDPSSGEPALSVVQESGVGSRATRWYSGDGPPPTTLPPPPAVGDFYLDRLSGQVYELSAGQQLLYRLLRIVLLGMVLYSGWLLVTLQPDLAKRLLRPPDHNLTGRVEQRKAQIQTLLRTALDSNGEGLHTLVLLRWEGGNSVTVLAAAGRDGQLGLTPGQQPLLGVDMADALGHLALGLCAAEQPEALPIRTPGSGLAGAALLCPVGCASSSTSRLLLLSLYDERPSQSKKLSIDEQRRQQELLLIAQRLGDLLNKP